VSCGGDYAVLRLFCFDALRWFVAPLALAPGLQQCSLDLPPQAPTRLVAPLGLARGLTQYPRPLAAGLTENTPPIAPAVQRRSTDPPKWALFGSIGFVAPPALAPGLHHCCARAKPVSCGGDWAVLRLYATPRFIWLVAPPALAPGLQPCSTNPPSGHSLRWSPCALAAVNPATRVLLVCRSPGARAGAPALQH
jgi:hypothetical protein